MHNVDDEQSIQPGEHCKQPFPYW